MNTLNILKYTLASGHMRIRIWPDEHYKTNIPNGMIYCVLL
jgi:hypothetical protein